MHPLGAWAYLAIAGMVIVEGPVATLIGAVAASAGYLKPQWVFLSAAGGNLTSDTLWYLLGYLGKFEWMARYERWTGFKQEQLNNLQTTIRMNALKMIFLAKLTMSFMIPVLIATGLARVPWKRWFPVLFLGECIWTGGLIFLGYHFGRYLQTVEYGLRIFAIAGGALFLILLARQLIHSRRKHAHAQGDLPSSS